MAITSIQAKLAEANTIKNQIRTIAATKDIEFPADAPFADYPTYIGNIKGHLEEKTFTPTAAGGDIPITSGYDGFSKVTLPAEPNLIPANIPRNLSIFGVAGIAEIPQFDMPDFFAGTLTSIILDTPTALRSYCFYQYNTLQSITANNVQSVGTYCFQNNTVLTTVAMAALRTIGVYAFYGCTALTSISLGAVETIGTYGLYNCRAATNLAKLIARQVDSYGCYYLGYNGIGFNYEPASAATLGTYAFQYAKVLSVKGPFASIGSYAFQYCSSLTELKPTITGVLSTYGFGQCYAVNDVDFSTCHITSLGTYALYCLGASRSSPSTNRLTLDFRNCTFVTVDQYSLAGTSTYKILYADIYLPDTAKTVNAYAFAYNDNTCVYFKSATPPTLSASTGWNGSTNYKIFVPYGSMHAYTSAANWSSLTSYIVGYAPIGTFEPGEVLPVCDNAGYALTWYSDAAKTTQITTAPAVDAELYCAVGGKAYNVFTASDSNSAYLTVTDGSSVVYTGNPIFIPVAETEITVDIVLSGEYDYKAFVGSTEIQFPYTTSISGDLNIKYFVMDGSFNPDFANATWAEIQYASLAGAAASLYSSYIGTQRTITLKNGTTMHVKLVNCTDDLYEKADGSGNTGLVFQFEELYPTKYYMNSSSTNSGGWDGSYMRKTVMPIVLAQLPDDLQAVLATVKIKGCNSGTSGAINTSEDKLFLPAEREIFASRNYSRTEEWNVLKQWQYYANNSAASIRIKKLSGTATVWWLRSPYWGSSANFVHVSPSGSVSYNGANSSYGVAPGFCI